MPAWRYMYRAILLQVHFHVRLLSVTFRVIETFCLFMCVCFLFLFFVCLLLCHICLEKVLVWIDFGQIPENLVSFSDVRDILPFFEGHFTSKVIFVYCLRTSLSICTSRLYCFLCVAIRIGRFEVKFYKKKNKQGAIIRLIVC